MYAAMGRITLVVLTATTAAPLVGAMKRTPAALNTATAGAVRRQASSVSPGLQTRGRTGPRSPSQQQTDRDESDREQYPDATMTEKPLPTPDGLNRRRGDLLFRAVQNRAF